MNRLLPHLKNYNLILASGSPRRQELLKNLGFNFKIELRPIKENYPATLRGSEIPTYLAELKAGAFHGDLMDNDVLITGDTIVSLDKEALGKPKDRHEAEKMLQALSGRSHHVISSVCLTTPSKTTVFHDSTKVYFKELSKAEIDHYITHFNPFDKAGAYGIQEWIGMIGVEKIEGSYFTVMGFPVHKFYQELAVLLT